MPIMRWRTSAERLLGLFFTQSPSFLSCQKTLQQAKGRSNAQSLFQVEQIPCDNHYPPNPRSGSARRVIPLYDEVFESLQEAGCLESWRAVHDTTLLALDGTWYPLVAKITPQLFLSGHQAEDFSSAVIGLVAGWLEAQEGVVWWFSVDGDSALGAVVSLSDGQVII